MDVVSQTKSDFQKNYNKGVQGLNPKIYKSEKALDNKSIEEKMKDYDIQLYINKIETEKLLKVIPQIIKDSKKKLMRKKKLKSKKKRQNRTAKKKKKKKQPKIIMKPKSRFEKEEITPIGHGKEEMSLDESNGDGYSNKEKEKFEITKEGDKMDEEVKKKNMKRKNPEKDIYT